MRHRFCVIEHQSRVTPHELAQFGDEHPLEIPHGSELEIPGTMSMEEFYKGEEAPEERKRRAWEHVASLFDLNELSAKDTEPYRVRTAWRITRKLALICGFIEPDQALSEEIPVWAEEANLWVVPREPMQGGRLRRRNIDIVVHKILANAAAMRSDVKAFCPPEDPHVKNEPTELGNGAFALVPPMVGWRFREKDPNLDSYLEVRKDYKPAADPMLRQWIAAVKAIVAFLGLEEGPENRKFEGKLGLDGLLEPSLCRLFWPSPSKIVYWEEKMIEQTADALSEWAPYRVQSKFLTGVHGLTRMEGENLVKIAAQRITESMELEKEEQAALMTLRLQSFSERARASLDLRAELAAYKQIAIIQGLNQHDEDGGFEIFGRVVRQLDDKDGS